MLLAGASRVVAQELRVGADFVTLFDNKEYATMKFETSGTLFSARLTPKVGIAWDERNELMFGAEMLQDFGHDSDFLSDKRVQMYYAFRAPRVTLLAGIFPRAEMRGLATPMFFDRDRRYYNNTLSGVLARYENPDIDGSYVEFAMDYMGMRDFSTREAFMIMFSGYLPIKAFNLGFDFLMGHYAKDYNPETIDGVVDNLMITPYIGGRLKAGEFAIDLRLTYIQALQRDRINENRWMFPAGGELHAAISRWGVTLSNRLYLGGGSLMTYYNRYGGNVYYGSPIYATTEHIYDSIAAYYTHRFFNNTVALNAGIMIDYDGTGWGTRQWLQLSVDIDYGISLKKKVQHVE